MINIIWNRWNQVKDTKDARPSSINGYQLNYFHGHDPYQSNYPQVHNLDTPLGKETPTNQRTNIKYANTCLIKLKNEDTPPEEKERLQKIEPQRYLDAIQHYKVLDSDEKRLNQKHDPKLIDQEFLQAKAIARRKIVFTSLFVALGFIFGGAIGGILVSSGLFAPFGLGIWGILGLAAVFGGGLAVVSAPAGLATANLTKPPAVNTVVGTLELMNLICDGASKALSKLGKSIVQNTINNLDSDFVELPNVVSSNEELNSEEQNNEFVI